MGNVRSKRSKRKRTVPAKATPGRDANGSPNLPNWIWLLLLVALIGLGGVVAGRLRSIRATNDLRVDRPTAVSPALATAAASYTPPETFDALKAEAFQVVDDLLLRYPDDPLSLEKAAQLAGVFGEKELARSRWQRCIELAPQHLPARYALTWLALRDGRYDEMAEQSRAALMVDRNSIAFRNLLGCALVELRQPQEAREVLEASLRDDVAQGMNETVYCDTYTLLGKASLLERDYAQAAEFFAEAVRLDPKWSKALYGLGTSYARIGRREEAKDYLERFRETQTQEVVKSHPEQLAAAQHDVGLVYRNIAAIYSQRGDVASSQRLQLWATQIDPAARAEAALPSHLQGRVSDAGN